MGYDAGVAWLTLRDANDSREVYALLAPWDLFCDGWSVVDDTRSEWARENNDPRWIVGPCGDDFPESPTLYDLPRFIEDLRALLADPAYGLDAASTWADVADEIATRPVWLGDAPRWFREWVDAAREEWPDGVAVEWADALARLVECDGAVPNVRYEETYT